MLGHGDCAGIGGITNMAKTAKGHRLSQLVKAPVTRQQLKLYAEASSDTNPIHLDETAAQKAGLPGVIAHGMLTMAFMGEFLHQALDELGGGQIREMSCRFKAMVLPGDIITVTGVVREVSGDLVECDLETRNQRGGLATTGHAVLELVH